MARIYGILRNATGIRPNTKIILTAKRTSTQVVIFAPDRLVTTDANGRYDIECNVCSYLVTIVQSGFPIEHVGNINVYADSADGTLESFLTDIREDELTPEVIKRVEEAAKLAELSASKAEQAAASAADDAINNVLPTLDNKIKLANDEVIKASKEVTKAKGEVTKATTQADIAKDAAQEALHNASLTFISGGTFTPTANSEYPNVVDVVRDTIWLISFPNRDDKYVYTTGVLKDITVKSGDQLFYDTPQDEFKWLPSGAGGAVYSVNGKTGTSITLTSDDVNAYNKSQTDKKLEEAVKVKSVNGHTGDVVINAESVDTYNKAHIDAQQVALQAEIVKQDAEIAKLKQYPTPWVAIGTAGHAQFVGNGSCTAGETMCRWEGKDTYRLKGIIRGIERSGGVISLPEGYTSPLGAAQYLGKAGSSVTSIYFLSIENDNLQQIQWGGDAMVWVMFDATIIVKEAK